MRRQWKRGLLSAIQRWACEAGKRAKDVINMVMYIFACVGSQRALRVIWSGPLLLLQRKQKLKKVKWLAQCHTLHSKASFGTVVSCLSVQCPNCCSMTP